MTTETLISPLQDVLTSLSSEGFEVDSVDFKIHNYGVVVVINGAEKHISLDSFLAAITSSSSQSEDGSIEGVLLPSNTFFFARSATRINLSCYYAEGVRNVKYGSHDRPSVIPNIIVSHVLNKNGQEWVINTTRYFCTDKPVSALPGTFINAAKLDAGIFGLPFSNTYSDNRMCYGGNSMPHVFRNNNLRGLDWYYQYLFETPFNDDLGINGLYSRVTPETWYARLAKLAEEGASFPYKDLAGFTQE